MRLKRMRLKHKISVILFFIVICFFTALFFSIKFNNKVSPTNRSYLDEQYAVIDGKVVDLKNYYEVPRIDNAVHVDASRFVFCEDGQIIDLYEVSDSDITETLITELNSTVGIREIKAQLLTFDIFTNDGQIYIITYPDAFKRFEPESGLKRDTCKLGDPIVWLTINTDLTVICEFFDGNTWIEYPGYSNTALWKNIIDACVGKNFVIGLTSDGKVLSDGIDFSVDNAIRIDVLNHNGDSIPLALTEEGRIVAPENINSPIVSEAMQFTDIVDFIATNNGIILAKKSDGSLIATTNDIYNPEYVSQP